MYKRQNTATCAITIVVGNDVDPLVSCPLTVNPYFTDPGQCHASLSFEADVSDAVSYTHLGFPLEEDMLPIYEDGLFTEGTWSLIPESLTSTDYDLELTGTGFTSGGEEDGTVRILKRPDNGGDWILDGMHVPCLLYTSRCV